jgi:hypothetical protein
MTLPAVRFLPEALEELLETQRWYGMREPALANDFAQTFPLIHGRIRRLVLSRFPYAFYFREQGAEILVIALHGRQHPDRWQRRS